MGLSSWFRDLGVPWKISIGILSGVAAVTSAYGLFTLYINQKSIDQKKKSDDRETAGDAAEKKVLVLGLENSGKSTFLAALAQHDSPVTSEREVSQPTQGFNVVCVSTGGVSLNVWEIGGKVQSYWPNFLSDVSVIVYVIDSSASAKFTESKDALLAVLSEESIKGVPLILLACKQDVEGARPRQEVESFFGLQELSANRKTGIVGVEVLSSGAVHGLEEAKELILKFCVE